MSAGERVFNKWLSVSKDRGEKQEERREEIEGKVSRFREVKGKKYERRKKNAKWMNDVQSEYRRIKTMNEDKWRKGKNEKNKESEWKRIKKWMKNK